MNNKQYIEIDDGYRSTYNVIRTQHETGLPYICHSISNAMLHAYMLYHSTYKDIIKNTQCNGPCSEIIADLMDH